LAEQKVAYIFELCVTLLTTINSSNYEITNNDLAYALAAHLQCTQTNAAKAIIAKELQANASASSSISM